MNDMKKMLEVKNLTVSYGDQIAVHDVSFSVDTGKIVMLVGESGSGKSTVLKSILGLLDAEAVIQNGNIYFKDMVLPVQNKAYMRLVLGKDIATILQDPARYLDPMMNIGNQYYETMAAHSRISKKEARKQAEENLLHLGFEQPAQILRKKPYELSGGMCQRAAIAIAMANKPMLLIGDEPTSALDVVLQEEVMEQLINFRNELGTTIFIVTHNMSIVARYADIVGIMKQGFLVEWALKDEILTDAKHPYTRMLLSSVPKLNGDLFAVEELASFDLLEDAVCQKISDTHWYLKGGC